jgi:hypothetical protein
MAFPGFRILANDGFGPSPRRARRLIFEQLDAKQTKSRRNNGIDDLCYNTAKKNEMPFRQGGSSAERKSQ